MKNADVSIKYHKSPRTVTTQNHRDIPSWVNVVFACEVFGGVLGCIALLMLKRWAWILFVVSLLGTLAQTTNIWFLTDAIDVMGNS